MPQNFLLKQTFTNMIGVSHLIFASNALSFLVPPVSAFRPKSGSSCPHSALSAFRPKKRSAFRTNNAEINIHLLKWFSITAHKIAIGVVKTILFYD